MVRYLLTAAVGVAALTCGGAAEAAFITYDFTLSGAGTRTTQYAGVPLVQSLIGANVSIGFNVPDTAVSNASGQTFNALYNLSSTTSALSIGLAPLPGQFNEIISGSGTLFFSTLQSGSLPRATVAINAPSSTFSFSDTRAAGLPQIETFSGIVTSFRVTSALTGTNFVSLAGVIPEPSTWALMLAGFGLTGYALRKRRVSVALVPTA